MKDEQTGFPIVGIGASAGGIAAMEALFSGIGEAPGMAFVVVTHLSPERESLMPEILQRFTKMNVEVAEDDTIVLPNNVYVMAANSILSLKNRTLQVTQADIRQRERRPIDIFLGALAADQREMAIGIILSGGDSDGTLGLKAIKERGGLTLAQIPDGAAAGPLNPEMPESAISSGLVDIAAPAEKMGSKLDDYLRGMSLLDDLTVDNQKLAEKALAEIKHEIFDILNAHSGHDFSGYKIKTIMRRLKRRMQILQIEALPQYVQRLKDDDDEVAILFRDLLINVTNFFRDKDAFEFLEKSIIPQIFEGKTAKDTVRIWIPGCATGEEVYSIGILLREQLEGMSNAPRIQIFATDIDEPALAIARSGRYPETLLEGLSAERRERFFIHDGSSYVIRKSVRDLCIFSPHSVIRDPPFSRMDLVSCRNLLIYFGPDIQHAVIPTFHYALRPGGFLFLGTSESIGKHSDLFNAIDKKHRVFRARDIAHMPASWQFNTPDHIGSPGAKDRGPRQSTSRFPLRQSIETHVLEHHTPAHVVVDAEGEIVYYSARTGAYLEAPQGVPSRQILSLTKRELRMELRSALSEARQNKKQATRYGLAVNDPPASVVDLTVEPLPERGAAGEPMFMVLFVSRPAPLATDTARNDVDDTTVADLERELRETKENLQAVAEEYETTLEELKSSNEELVSVNEEAQSTNEELEASKEELQSLNEELNTINSELATKIDDLASSHADLENLFESTRIATVFLDRNLVIRTYTPAASEFFSLRKSDVGRPLTDLATPLEYPELRDHIATVFETGKQIEHKLSRSFTDTHHLVRIIPYKDGRQRTRGVVVTFIDVTRLAQSEAQQDILIAELNHRVKNMLAVVISIANSTMRRATSLDAFGTSFTDRLHAMARTYDHLTSQHWKQASVGELVRQELEPFGMERFTLNGGEETLSSEQGFSLGLLVHELVTNAAKYGALSTSAGHVVVTAGVSGDLFSFNWRESDGPKVAKPATNGFGLSLLKGEIEHRLGGTVVTDFRPDGVEITLSFPV